ncbi:hypothetical protein GCM10027403_25840 [Arthrobacter tecti]
MAAVVLPVEETFITRSQADMQAFAVLGSGLRDIPLGNVPWTSIEDRVPQPVLTALLSRTPPASAT